MTPPLQWTTVAVAGLAIATAVRGTIQSLGHPIAVLPLVGFVALGVAGGLVLRWILPKLGKL